MVNGKYLMTLNVTTACKRKNHCFERQPGNCREKGSVKTESNRFQLLIGSWTPVIGWKLACTQTLFYCSFRSFRKHRRARSARKKNKWPHTPLRWRSRINPLGIRVIWIISAPQPEIFDKTMVVSLLLSFVFIPNHPQDARGPLVGLCFCLCCRVTFYDILLT